MFQDEFTKEQLATILVLACSSFHDAMECLLTGPNLEAILKLMMKISKTYPVVKLGMDVMMPRQTLCPSIRQLIWM